MSYGCKLSVGFTLRVKQFITRSVMTTLSLAAAASVTAAEPAKPVADKRAGVELRPSAEVECRWASGPIRIDGRADEPAWIAAAVVEKFTTPWQKGEPAALTPWKARILWDRQYLYFH